MLADAVLRSLRASGAVVAYVATGSKADTTLITHSEFDLLILDLGLPTMDGLEILRRLRARRSHLPVLALTAAGNVEERVKSLDNGADDCMAKPFSFEELKARVRALLLRGMRIAGSAIRHGPLVYD
ncbi:response regulator [Microbacterium sp. P5_E9]